jgi:hypothetical protein
MNTTNRFSPCSVGNICSGFANKQVLTTCLTSSKDVTLFTAGECGNGIVEAGEDCDCGGLQACQGDPCCDPTTCAFTTGSVCDDSTDECCQSCQFAPSTRICRASVDPTCDPQETCTGNSSACPKDITAQDGTQCGNGRSCASGSCTSTTVPGMTNQSLSNLSRARIGSIIGGILGGVAVLVGIIVSVLVCKRTSQSRRNNDTSLASQQRSWMDRPGAPNASSEQSKLTTHDVRNNIEQ